MSPILVTGTIIVNLALLSYAIGVITEQRSHRVSAATLNWLRIGVVLDITATVCMIAGSSSGPFTPHGFLGFSSLAAMIVETSLAWKHRSTSGARRGGFLEYKYKLSRELLQRVSRERIVEAIEAEGVPMAADRYSSFNYTYGLLHTAPLFTEFDRRSIGGCFYDPTDPAVFFVENFRHHHSRSQKAFSGSIRGGKILIVATDWRTHSGRAVHEPHA